MGAINVKGVIVGGLLAGPPRSSSSGARRRIRWSRCSSCSTFSTGSCWSTSTPRFARATARGPGRPSAVLQRAHHRPGGL